MAIHMMKLYDVNGRQAWYEEGEQPSFAVEVNNKPKAKAKTAQNKAQTVQNKSQEPEKK